MRRRLIVAAGLTLALVVSTAFAQSQFKTPATGQVQGSVSMCLNGAGLAVPVSSGACANASAVSGNMGGYNIGVAATPTVQAAAYAASNAIGGLITYNFMRTVAQPSGILSHIFVAFKAGAVPVITAYIFDTNPTASTCTDKTAFALNAADVSKLAMAPFSLTPAVSQGTTVSSVEVAIPRSIKNMDGTPTTSVYVCLVVGGAVTPGSTSDMVVKLFGALD